MLAREHRFVTRSRVAIQLRAARWIDILRHVTKEEHDFVFNVEAVIRIVARAGSVRHRQAVACKHDFTFRGSIFAERERPEVAVECSS